MGRDRHPRQAPGLSVREQTDFCVMEGASPAAPQGTASCWREQPVQRLRGRDPEGWACMRGRGSVVPDQHLGQGAWSPIPTPPGVCGLSAKGPGLTACGEGTRVTAEPPAPAAAQERGAGWAACGHHGDTPGSLTHRPSWRRRRERKRKDAGPGGGGRAGVLSWTREPEA